VIISHNNKKNKVGIGFATGRKNFQQVLKTYIYNWHESGLVENKMVSLNLFIAYDLTYNKTKISDYTNFHEDLVDQIDDVNFIDSTYIKKEIDYLIEESAIESEQAKMIFGKGYAAKRNAILYSAIKQNVDYLIFLDDDEYPMAVTNTKKTAIWGGQHVLRVHLTNIEHSDITHGHHCGYISPIPYIEYDDIMHESDFRSFIEAISNDIINWNNIKNVMNDGGVTYADIKILTSEKAVEVPETNHTKFISGANLCINLTDPSRVLPFYNPPGARGEDTFLSTCLSERTVFDVPCYTFHDGFSTYSRLLEGVLPTKLKYSKADNEEIIERFYKACIGWVRYKPLMTYITQHDSYNEKIEEMKEKLNETLPIICTYFQKPNFMNILTELDKYNKNVEKHYNDFQETQEIWANIMKHFQIKKINWRLNYGRFQR